MGAKEKIKEFAESIQSTSDMRADPNLKFLVHGGPGVGKTYAIRTLPGKTLVGSVESGEKSILDIDVDIKELTSMDEVNTLFQMLKYTEHPYDWLALDSVTEIAEICLSEKKEECKHGQQAYGQMQEEVIQMLRNFRGLDMNVYFSAKQERTKTQDGMLYVPNMPGSKLTSRRPVGHDFDFVFPIVVSEDETGETHRKFLTTNDGQHQAKARDPSHVLDKYEPVDIGSIYESIVNSYN